MVKKARIDSAESLKDSSDYAESAKDSNNVDCHEALTSRNDDSMVDCHDSTTQNLVIKARDDSAESTAKSHNDEDSAKEPRFRSIIIGANGLSLGISIVVAILLGIGAGILMQKIFGVFWVLFLGVLWGILAAILNVYKVYKAELRDFEKLAENPKYQHSK